MDDDSPFLSIARASDIILLEKSTNCITLPAKLRAASASILSSDGAWLWIFRILDVEYSVEWFEKPVLQFQIQIEVLGVLIIRSTSARRES